MIPIDSRSQRTLATFRPEARAWFEALYQAAQGVVPPGWSVRFISGYRTYAEQAELYAQGRTKPGNIVTNARPGFSNHNFGLAVDVGIFDENGQYKPESPFYERVGTAGKRLGLRWGGDWKFKDMPHFEVPHTFTLKELRKMVSEGRLIPIPDFKPSGADLNPVSIYLDGKEISPKGRNEAGTIWVPARATLAALGGKVYNVNSRAGTLVLQIGTASTVADFKARGQVGWFAARDLRRLGIDVRFVDEQLLLRTP